jgi:hypothetical protein
MMQSYSKIRSFVRASLCMAILAAPVTFGAAADRQQAQAHLLDHAELLCTNCFFGTSDYYYCLATDNKVLIGYQRTPVFNWRDKSKNYLTKAHAAWTSWSAPGDALTISYDDKHIWVDRGDKQVRLVQNYSRDIFTGNSRCQDVVRSKAH